VSVRLATSFGTSAVTKKFCPPFSGCLGIFSNAHSASPPIAKLITEYSTSSLLNSGGRVFAGGVWLGPYRLHFRDELFQSFQFGFDHRFLPSVPPCQLVTISTCFAHRSSASRDHLRVGGAIVDACDACTVAEFRCHRVIRYRVANRGIGWDG
jgi:hypothetical protein